MFGLTYTQILQTIQTATGVASLVVTALATFVLHRVHRTARAMQETVRSQGRRG